LTSIKCSVDECEYWADNLCRADEIEVASVFTRQDDPDLELSDLGGMGASRSSEDTMCRTFRPAE